MPASATQSGNSPAAAPKRRRWFRYSLRTLLLLVTALCVVLGICHERARKQREAVAVARKYSLTISYRHQIGLDGKVLNASQVPQLPWPRWLTEFLGEDYFVTVVRIRIEPKSDSSVPSADQMTDADYTALGQLNSLENLFVRDVPLEDRHLLAWKGLKHLESLSLINTKVSDRSIPAISQCIRLKTLQIQTSRPSGKNEAPTRVDLTDQGLAALQHLSELENLFLMNSKISDASERVFAQFAKLTRLNLAGTDITDASLQTISRLPALQELSVGHTQVTDEGIRALVHTRSLTRLFIGSTCITDAGLESLQAAPMLQKVYIDGTRVTPAGAERFRTATRATVE